MATLACLAAGLTPFALGAFGSNTSQSPGPSAQAVEPPRGSVRTTAVAPTAPPGPARDRPSELTLSPPYEIADALTIVSETRRVRLAGLEAPGAESACFDPQNHLWACGLQGRAALHNLIRLQPVSCRLTGDKLGDVALADCKVGPTKLDSALVQLGFAKPAAATGTLARELADAKAAGRGLWNGGWRIKPTG